VNGHVNGDVNGDGDGDAVVHGHGGTRHRTLTNGGTLSVSSITAQR
jgi:hypothetical protein